MRDDLIKKAHIGKNKKFSQVQLKLTKSYNEKNIEVIICLEKAFDKPNIIVGVLPTINNELNEKIKDKLEKYNHKPSFWLCDRYEDSWEENKNNPKKYAEELIKIYEQIEEIK